MIPGIIRTIITVFMTAIFILPFRAPAAADPVVPPGPWEYRWGDPPGFTTGMQAPKGWGEGGAGWTPAETILDPPGRNGNTVLWLRTSLPRIDAAEPAVYLDSSHYHFEAYIGTNQVYRFGAIPAERTDYRGRPWHLFHATGTESGARLCLRVHSRDRHIGIPGSVLYGPHSAHINRLMRNDFWRVSLSVLFIITGCFALLAWFHRKNEKSILGFSCAVILIAVWNISISKAKQLYLDAPVAWLYIEHVSLYFTPVAVGLFFEHFFGRGPGSVIRTGWRVHLFYAIISLSLAAFSPYWLRAYTLRPFQIMLAMYLIVLCASVVARALAGNRDARTVACGLAITIAFTFYDIFTSIMELSYRTSKSSHWGLFIFLLTLGIVLERRYTLVLAQMQRVASGGLITVTGKRRSASGISPDTREKLDRAIDYLRAHYNEDISREGLAAHVGMNYDYFGRTFLAYTGRKVGRYINELRIDEAKRLLASSDRSIVDIAFAVGFESLSTFYRVFQEIAGLAPSAFRTSAGHAEVPPESSSS